MGKRKGRSSQPSPALGGVGALPILLPINGHQDELEQGGHLGTGKKGAQQGHPTVSHGRGSLAAARHLEESLRGC